MTHRIFFRTALAVLFALPLLAPLPAAAKDKGHGKVLATVNGVAIPQRWADFIFHQRSLHGQNIDPQLREAVRRQLIDREVLAQAAQRAGVTKDPDVQAQIALTKQMIEIQAYLRDYLKKHPVTQQDIEMQYQGVKARAGSKQYHLHHILVRTDAEAKKIIAQLDNGGNFEKLAKKDSIDQGSNENGGDLGWQVPADFESYGPAFAAAVVKLKPGHYTEKPVHTRYGYHIIRLDGERPVQFAPLDKIEGRIRQQLTQAKIQRLIAELRNKARIEE